MSKYIIAILGLCLVNVSNAATFTYILTYDASNRITQVTAGGTNRTNYTWQDNGQLLTRTTEGNRLIGDLDNSGVVDLADAVLACQIITSLSPLAINPAADINNDGKLGLPEVLYVLRKVVE